MGRSSSCWKRFNVEDRPDEFVQFRPVGLHPQTHSPAVIILASIAVPAAEVAEEDEVLLSAQQLIKDAEGIQPLHLSIKVQPDQRKFASLNQHVSSPHIGLKILND